jgi:putative hydrolase of the HAD superfamily
MSESERSTEGAITTLLFDVDDTLYDLSNGFTENRNGYGVQHFMVKYLNFPDFDSAKLLRDEYFERYHSTAKALTVAEQEGRLPSILDTSDPRKWKSPRFDPLDLAEFFATELDFTLLGGPKPQLANDLLDCRLNLVAFSNGPRKYVKRVLNELGLWGEVFNEETLFAVDDVLPYCKPEKEAFEKVFQQLGVTANECIIIEDSMKNIRKAKELGLKTILVVGEGRLAELANLKESETTKPINDFPVLADPSVDVVIETVEELRSILPGLWRDPAVFEPPARNFVNKSS